MMKGKFEMSMMGELTNFLGLQVKQLEDGIFIIQKKYTKELIAKYRPEKTRRVKIPMGQSVELLINKE